MAELNLNIDELMEQNALVADYLYYQDIKRRILYLDTDISQITVGNIVQQIIRYNIEDKLANKKVEDREPIRLFLVSYGGEVDAGFELIDAIRNSATPIYVINIGYQYSMGFLIGLAGHKRYATYNAKYLIHDGSQFIFNSAGKARDQMRFNEHVEDRIKEYVLSRTKIDEATYDRNNRNEWYMFADEAKDYGIVDYILGEDCTLDDIL